MNDDAFEDRPRALSKMPTGVAGLDRVLLGGLPQERTVVLQGGPGSGKTVLALEILYRAAETGSPGVFISFEEREDAIRSDAMSMGWDLRALERAGRLALIHPQIDYQVLRAGDFSINGLLAIVAGKTREMGARLLVIDAVDALMQLFDNAERERDELYGLNQWLKEHNLTTLLTSKTAPGIKATRKYQFLDFLADCVIHLDQRIGGQVTTRRLRVAKFRGAPYSTNEHPFLITSQGVVLMPVSSVSLTHQALGSKVSSGQPKLDDMLDGGYRQGAAVLVAGPTGSGKTSLVCAFARAACRRGERVLYTSFEESKKSLVEGMLSPGIDLRPLLEAGTLEILTAMPESMGTEEHLLRILQVMQSFRPRHLVVDAISATARMGSEQAAFDFLVRLLNECKDRGVTCILTNQTGSRSPQDEISGIGVSSLIDTVLVLEYVRRGPEIGRTLFVLKARGTRHSHLVHGLSISDGGILLKEPASPAGSGADGDCVNEGS